MLKALIYCKVDKEINYAATEIINRLGIPYEKINDIDKITKKSKHNVVIIPESAKMSPEEEETVFNSRVSVISLGYIPQQKVCKGTGFEVIDKRVVKPPQTSGILHAMNNFSAPFFHDFPIVKIIDGSTRLIGKIETGSEEYPGIIIKNVRGSSKVFIFPSLFKSIIYFFSGACKVLPRSQIHSLKLSDELGRIMAEKVKKFQGDFIYRPIIEIYCEILLFILKKISKKKCIPIVQKWYHPKNHNMTLCITHDIDVVAGINIINTLRSLIKDFQIKKGLVKLFLGFIHKISSFMFKTHISNVRDTLKLIPLWISSRLLSYNPVWNFDIYSKIDEEFDTEYPTYFFQVGLMRGAFEGLNGSIEIDYTLDNPLIKRTISLLKEKGAEIGLHGSLIAYNCLDNLKIEKKKLENLIGEIIGIRQHRQIMLCPETWINQEKVGLQYDTSLGYVDDVGFRAGTGIPFYPWDIQTKRKISILELPIIIVDGTLFQERFLNYSEKQALEVCSEIINTTNKYSSVLTLLWHPHHDRVVQEYWMTTYREVLRYASKYRPWYTGAGELVKWWTLRNDVTFGSIEISKSSLIFSIHSPKTFQGFSVRIWFPFKPSLNQVIVNGQTLSKDNILNQNNFLLFKFKVCEGNNQIIINY